MNLMVFSDPPKKSKFQTLDLSENQIVLKTERKFEKNVTQHFADFTTQYFTTIKKNISRTQKHLDLSSHDYSTYKKIVNATTNNYALGFTLDGQPCAAIELAGVYKVSTGLNTFQIGPTALRPIITLVGSTTVGVQVGDTWTEPGVSAQDYQGNALTVVTSGTVDTSILGISTLTYTAVSPQGDIAEVKQRFIVATDTTSPALTLVGGNISLTQGDTWGGEPGYSAIDNLDGDLTSQVQITGWDGDTTSSGQFTRTYTVTDSQSNVASTFRTATIAVPYFFQAAGPWTSPQWFSTGLGTTLTSELDQMSRGTGHGYEIKFSYKRSSDPQGVILSITDSSYSDRYYEGPSTTAAIAFRNDATWGVMVRLPQSHSSWGNNRYLYEALGYSSWSSAAVYGHTQTNWNTITCRVYDKDSSNWGLVMFVNSSSSGSQYISRTFAKGFPNGQQLSFPGRTSTWTGYSVNCVETGGQVTTSGGWKITPGGEVKDISIASLSPTANHTVP